MKKFSFFNYQFTKGFTLLELLTVIGILSVIGTIAVSVISITLRGAKKTDLLESARQNGDAALSQMVKGIRYASSLNSPAVCIPTASVSAITITSLTDYAQTTFSCTGGSIASNSAPLLDTTSITVSSCFFTCSQATNNDPPTILIQFTLSPKNSGSFTETKFQLPFQSSVTMRNY
ncbi:MAG TPA: type II secretion system protein [Candidatus Sulfotelmatobacter sp.]|jgi:prepilin-type N-terminal cleavage/methylation domain-containing protein|nr:type II secretion system protein [Candidatus Sulfotelmatobacter sp.]